ncbi:MAG TPA: hypothetical protein VIL54_12045 [Natronosporangium sp.]
MTYDEHGRAVALTPGLERDEEGQARYLVDLLRDYDAGGVEAAFVYTFANRHLPTTDDPERDFDLASRGIVRVWPDGSWTPKAAFHALAEYGRTRARRRAGSSRATRTSRVGPVDRLGASPWAGMPAAARRPTGGTHG